MARKKRRAKRASRRRELDLSPQEVLAKALSHPLRVKVLAILSKKIASPTEISSQVDMPLGNVAYHVRVLEELGLIELVKEERAQGSIAHFYKPVKQSIVEDPHWRDLDPGVRNILSSFVIKTVVDEAANSLATGLFDQREDHHASHIPVHLDEAGWQQVSEIIQEAKSGVLRVQAATAERLNSAGSKPIHATVAMFLFEVAPSTNR